VKEEILKRFDKMVREGDFGVISGSDSVRSFISEVIELLTKSKQNAKKNSLMSKEKYVPTIETSNKQ